MEQQAQLGGAPPPGLALQQLQLGQEMVPLSMLVKRSAEAAYTGLKELCESLPDQSDSERKIALLKYILKTRQRLLRLLVICKWCRQIPLVQRCQQLVGTLSNHDVSFTQAADSLFYLHDGLLQSRAPMYDVPSAVEVLLTGSFRRMPKCIQDLASQPTLEGEKKEAALRTLDTVLRSKLLDVVIPKEFSRVSVQDGRVTLRVDGEFQVQLTLGYRGNASLWRVLNIELLVGERSGPAKLTEVLRLALADDLERRMAVLQEPCHIIYSVLHEFCSDLVMDTFLRQVRGLQQGRWMDAIRLELSVDSGQAAGPAPDGDGDGVSSSKPVLGLKIIYWLDLSKGTGPDSGLPSLRIEPGADQQLSCQHQPPVMDPYTETEADFPLNESCIDAENLILKAINCNIHTRLVEVQRSLKNNRNICRVDGDVMLRTAKQLLGSSASVAEKLEDGVQGEDVLLVRAFAHLYITLGISIRSGRFLIRAPDSLLERRVLQEMEEALNQGMSCINVFASLRTKSIVHHFAKLSASLNLQVYEKGAISLKIPENGPKFGPDALILCFPNTGDLYFLVLHLDSTFMLQFILLEVQQQGPASFRSSREVTVSRFMNIDIGKDLLSKDDINLSLLSSKPTEELPSKDKGSETKALPGPSSTQLRHAQSPYSSASIRAGYGSQASIFHNRRSPSTQHLQSPARRSSPSSDYFRSKSPLHADNPTSPAVIDDDDLSKLIDSIDSVPAKTMDMGPRSSPVSRMVKSSSRSSLLMPSQKASLPPLRKVPSEVSLGSPALKDSEDALHRLSSPSSLSQDKLQHSTKRKAGVDIFSSLPSLTAISLRKKTKTESAAQQTGDFSVSESFFGQPYVNVIAAANQGKAPAVCYLAAFLQVVKRCWLMIKYARVTSQMKSLGISYIEEETTASLIFRPSAPAFRGDMAKHYSGWQRIQLSFESLGSDAWEVKIRDAHYKSLWNLQKSKSASSEWGSIQFAALSEADAHIKCYPDGLLLSYKSVEEDSIKKLLVDLDRLRNARAFGLCMRKLLERPASGAEKEDMKWEAVRRSFKVEAFGLTSLWFSYTGCMPGLFARFVVDWGPGERDCTVHVSPEQLWPHTKYLEDYINGGDVELLLDAIRITAGPLHSLAGAIRPARNTTPAPNPALLTPTRHQGPSISPQAAAQNSQQPGSVNAVPGRAGVVPTSLLPTDISVLMRTPYWIRIVYRKQFAVDMRCFEGDQVWLQPAPPPQGAKPLEGGSFPCPQFRPFVMENVALGLNNPETPFSSPTASGFATASQPTSAATSPARPGQQKGPPQKGTMQPVAGTPGRSLVLGGPGGLYPGYKGELTAFCGMSDDGGYGGAWVPLATLKKVLRGTLKYLGILWLFAQFSPIIKDVLTSVMAWKEQHLHLDPEQPALRFNIGNCMFAVNMHRHQLYLQGINAKRYQQPHQQGAGQATGGDADLTSAEMSEITDFFARRVTAEPYDASRLASFVTMLTLPVPVLREFLALIAWKKEAQRAAQAQAVDSNSSSSSNSRPRIELRLENTVVISQNIKDETGSSSSVKSSITHDRERGIVEFALTVLLDLANVSVNVAGGAGWLPQCVSVRLRYHYNEAGGRLLMVGMEGSHGGRACWTRGDDWDRCKEKVASAVAEAAAAATEGSGRLRAVAESIQVTIQNALQQLRAG